VQYRQVAGEDAQFVFQCRRALVSRVTATISPSCERAASASSNARAEPCGGVQ
jgi:hypothetical protein